MPSLVCDLEELYRHRVDDFVLGYVQGLSIKDFISKTEDAGFSRKGKRVYLNDKKTREFMNGVNDIFKEKVNASTIRAKGKTQLLETLINEEVLLLAKFIRDEKKKWIPRN